MRGRTVLPPLLLAAVVVAAALCSSAAAADVNDITKICASTMLCKGVCRQGCNSITLAKLVQLAEKYPPGFTDQQLADALFTKDAALSVGPIGSFLGGFTALEYVTTFSRKAAVPPIAGLAGLKLVHSILQDNTAVAVFDLMLVSLFNSSLIIPLRGTMLVKFAPDSHISHITLDYAQYGDQARILTDGKNPVAEERIIRPVCAAQAKYCVGPNLQWASEDLCIAFMKSVPFVTPRWRLASNSVTCRVFHARFVDIDPTTHCPHVGPTGGGKCTDDEPLSYFYSVIDQNIPPGTFVDANPLILKPLKKFLSQGGFGGGDLWNGGGGALIGGLLGGGGAAAAASAAASKPLDLWATGSGAKLDAMLGRLSAREAQASARACAANKAAEPKAPPPQQQQQQQQQQGAKQQQQAKKPSAAAAAAAPNNKPAAAAAPAAKP